MDAATVMRAETREGIERLKPWTDFPVPGVHVVGRVQAFDWPEAGFVLRCDHDTLGVRGDGQGGWVVVCRFCDREAPVPSDTPPVVFALPLARAVGAHERYWSRI